MTFLFPLLFHIRVQLKLISACFCWWKTDGKVVKKAHDLRQLGWGGVGGWSAAPLLIEGSGLRPVLTSGC